MNSSAALPIPDLDSRKDKGVMRATFHCEPTSERNESYETNNDGKRQTTPLGKKLLLSFSTTIITSE